MMPYCEHYKCKRVASNTTGILRKWSSYDVYNPSHTQQIWLCKKHVKKINKLLQLATHTTKEDS